MSLAIIPTAVLGIKYQGFLNKQKGKCLKDPECKSTRLFIRSYYK